MGGFKEATEYAVHTQKVTPALESSMTEVMHRVVAGEDIFAGAIVLVENGVATLARGPLQYPDFPRRYGIADEALKKGDEAIQNVLNGRIGGPINDGVTAPQGPSDSARP